MEVAEKNIPGEPESTSYKLRQGTIVKELRILRENLAAVTAELETIQKTPAAYIENVKLLLLKRKTELDNEERIFN